MRVWLVACVIAVLVAGVAAAVVVLSGGEGEEPVEREAGSAVAEGEETPTFRYDRLDITGAVTTPGSLAFLQMAGNPFSAVPKFAFSAFGVVELRIHPVDADGISRADFYDTVRVNDTVDYRTWWPNGLNCASRFKVTSVGATASPRTFGIEHVPSGDLLCGNFVPPSGVTGVHLVWRPSPGVPGPGGVQDFLYGEPAGPGTYRLFPGLPCLVDVPVGMQVIHQGYRIGERPPGAPPDASRGGVMLVDAATGSKLAIDPATGRETRRIIESPEVDALFDQIMASVRCVDGVAAGGARAPVATPPEPVTLRYDRLDVTGAATAPGSYAFLEVTGDTATAIGNFGYSARGSVELRIHPADASGASRAAFYNTVQVGDRFDYRTDGLDCGFRFKVTSVAATTSPRTFGLEHITSFGGWCDFVDDPAAAWDVHFVWRVPPGIEGSRGVQVLLQGEPAGPGTYYIGAGLPYVIDVPAGFQVIYGGVITVETTADIQTVSVIKLSDADTGSALGIDADTGEEVARILVGSPDDAPDVHALFDQIMASIRTR